MFRPKKKVLYCCPNILTPDQIPKFLIPPKLPTMLVSGGHSRVCLEKTTSHNGSNPISRALLRSANQHIIQVEDVELETVAPEPHLNITAPIMGSPYLSESPHTRRRESLFHEMCPPHGYSQLKSLSPLDSNYTLSWRSSSSDVDLQHISLGQLESDTTSSAESSPFSSPLLARTLAGNLVGQVYSKKSLFCAPTNIKTLVRANSLSTEETSSTDTSPNVPRKQGHQGQEASMMHLVPPPVFHLDFICCLERLTKETEVLLSKGGLLHLSAEYMRDVLRLRVKLVSVENLYPTSQDPKTISCCTVMSLQPGKLQKQRSTVIRRSRNPIFNEDFFFEGVAKDELETRALRVKVVNRGTGVRRDQLLGSIELQLSAILPPLAEQ
ncbi:C2 calcium-dependent domain-containing protein 4D-like [Pelodytes ibericus]